MSKNSKLTRVKTLLAKNPKLTADAIVKHIDVTKVYAYNLLSSARKSLRMQSSLPEGMTEVEAEEIVADVNQAMAQHDAVNHPAHYKVGGIETIDFIEAKNLSYHLGNVVKYIARADSKGNREEDLLKARWYLNREIAKFTK
jgi:hypothetical protein